MVQQTLTQTVLYWRDITAEVNPASSLDVWVVFHFYRQFAKGNNS